MSSRLRGGLLAAGLVTVAAFFGTEAAHAWPCHHRHARHCGPVLVNPYVPAWQPMPWSYQSYWAPGCGFGGLSFGVTSYRTFTFSSPGFWCGSWYPCVVPLSPWGLYSFYPVPVFRPWVPFAQRPAAVVTRIAARPVETVRVANQATRLRAAKLVAIGDRHLRSAVADRGRLRAALDAYRRAETIAADEPDTILRQALVLTALERGEEAAAAIRRAVAVDGRLADAPAPDALAERLPPDPVFGDRPLGAPSPLAVRGAGLLAGIFRAEGGAGDGGNWIADRWLREVQGNVQMVARR